MRLLQDQYITQARLGLCLLGTLALPLLAGCGGGGGGGGSTSPTPIPTPAPLTVTGTTASGLTASLTEASSTVAVNGSLVYTLTITNSTANPIPVHTATQSGTPTVPAAGLIVRNASGTPVFSPLPPSAPLYFSTLAPGQSLTETITANESGNTGFSTPGTYAATATFGDDVGPALSLSPLTVTAQ